MAAAKLQQSPATSGFNPAALAAAHAAAMMAPGTGEHRPLHSSLGASRMDNGSISGFFGESGDSSSQDDMDRPTMDYTPQVAAS